MDALFVIVAELLLVPLVLWSLLAIELSIGLLSSAAAVVLGRRSPGEAAMIRWRSVRRRLLLILILTTAGLLLADLLFFEAIVSLALGSADDREQLDVHYANAEGSFILGRIELHGLEVDGRRGSPQDPSGTFELRANTLVIDLDTAAMLRFDFRVEELSLDGVEARYERLQAPKGPAPDSGFELRQDFAIERFHIGDANLVFIDHSASHGDSGTAPAPRPRELSAEITELDAGPLRSEAPIFDLLYRTRGSGTLRFGTDETSTSLPFTLTNTTQGGVDQSALELAAVPLEPFTDALERRAGLRARGQAELALVNRYRGGDDVPEPQVELELDAKLRGLELEAGEDAPIATRIMLEVAEDALTRLGDTLPVHFAVVIQERELLGLRNLAESGVVDRIIEAGTDALKEQLSERAGPG